jgi:predicted amidohydrolase
MRQNEGDDIKMTDYCLQGARLIDPDQKLDEVRDLAIINGKITFQALDKAVEKN